MNKTDIEAAAREVREATDKAESAETELNIAAEAARKARNNVFKAKERLDAIVNELIYGK